jgi:ubiquinone/menaquinone biosynthesis C-methylase UbiE
MGHRVDYERSAGAYRRARTLPPEVLARWTDAVTPFADASTGRVLDLGAGTGQFVEPLTRWFGADVVAVEPSEAMRAELRAALSNGAEARRPTIVAGTAEHLPLASDAVDVAWLSTVLHQFDDRIAAVHQLRRVVRSGGRVFVRGFFADQAVTGLLAEFPGIARAAATFPRTDAVVDEFAAGGFATVEVVDVIEPWRFELTTWVERARSIRHTDSALRPLTDPEFDAGLAAITAAHRADPGLVASDATLRLLVFA